MRCDKNIRWAICAALLAALGGCYVTTNGESAIAGTGETIHESNTVDLSKAKGVERVRVNLELHAG